MTNEKLNDICRQIVFGLFIGGWLYGFWLFINATCEFSKITAAMPKPAPAMQTNWTTIENPEFTASFPVRSEKTTGMFESRNVDIYSGRSPNLQFVLMSGYIPLTRNYNTDQITAEKFEKELLSDGNRNYSRGFLPDRSELKRVSGSASSGNGWEGMLYTIGSNDNKAVASILIAREKERQSPFYAALLTAPPSDPDVQTFVKSFTVKTLPLDEYNMKANGP